MESRKKSIVLSQPLENTQISSDGVSKALQNHLVLKNIFGFLSVKDLKQVRLVSRQWNKDSLSSIRKQVRYCFSYDPVSIVQLSEFLRINDTCTYGFPCARFHIRTLLLDTDQRLFYNVLRAISGYVVEVDIFVGNNKVCIEMDGITFPNLRKFSVSESVEEKNTLKCFQHVIQNAPLLQTLDLYTTPFKEEGMSGFFKAIGTSPIAKTLIKFYLETEIDDNVLLNFAKAKLNLKSLKLTFTISDDIRFNPEYFRACMESLSNTLEELTISQVDSSIYESDRFAFPRMKNLRSFKFYIFRDKSEFTFYKQFPMLKHLSVGIFGGSFSLSRSMEPLVTVESLSISETFDDSETFEQVARIFPMLRKLEANGPTNANGNAGNGLRNLEELTLRIGFYPEDLKAFKELLTGYTNTELEIVEKSWNKFGKLILKNDHKPSEFFQRLKILRVHMGELTDVLCLLGPMKMSSLECFDLRHSNYSQISQNVLEEMHTKFRVLLQQGKKSQ